MPMAQSPNGEDFAYCKVGLTYFAIMGAEGASI